jgi:folate-binding protein YgfZ
MQDSALKSPCFITLPGRGLLRISGSDRRAFLQGLISNDTDLLDSQPMLYACLLSAQGRFQHDFFVTEQDDTIILECEGGARTDDLYNILKKFKLRSSITLEPIPNIDTYCVFPSPLPEGGGRVGGAPDPRYPSMGHRTLTKPNLPESPFALWDHHRITLGIPDGSRDMIPGQSTLLECNIDRLNGISFSKGCYIGQELTARMHYRGLAKKHLITVHTPDNTPVPPPGTDLLSASGHLIGQMRSGSGAIGLALVRDDAHDLLPETGLLAFAS